MVTNPPAARTLPAAIGVTAVWLAVVLWSCTGAGAAEEVPLVRNMLWQVVNGLCVPRQQESGDPSPCVKVDLTRGLDRGFAVLNNPFERSAILVVPTARMIGLDDSQLLAPNAPNYWADAWLQRGLVESRLGRVVSRDWIAMAVNSARGRSQDQLHIHIDCVQADVRRTLRRNESRMVDDWTYLKFGSVQREYLARKVTGENLKGINPLHLLAAQVPQAAAQMAEQTLVVVGATFQNGESGFYFLSNQVDAKSFDRASGGELLDHSCGKAP